LEQREGLPEGAEVGDLVKRLPGVIMGGAPGEDKDARRPISLQESP
jgi:hypothetical protein